MRTSNIMLRVTPELKARISELAEKDGRSISQYVERVLLAHIATHDAGEKR